MTSSYTILFDMNNIENNELFIGKYFDKQPLAIVTIKNYIFTVHGKDGLKVFKV